jgi:hypothetical protein
MHSSIVVTKPAPDKALVTLYEAKIALNIPTSDTSSDEALKLMILRSSDEVGTLCSRVFPKEAVIETFREIVNPITRLYLSRWPVQPDDIESIEVDGAPADFDIDPESGKLSLYNGTFWAESVIATYAGGYEIPQGVPPALKNATLLLTRDAYYSSQRGDSSVRSITHKESRIMYFDPAAMMKATSGGSAGAGGGTAAQNAAKSLLQRYTRLTA